VRAEKVEEAAEELWDVLFMVFFLIYLYEQRGDFTLEEVCHRIKVIAPRISSMIFCENSNSRFAGQAPRRRVKGLTEIGALKTLKNLPRLTIFFLPS